MTTSLAKSLTLGALITLAGCTSAALRNQPGDTADHNIRSGPQTQAPTTPGPNDDTSRQRSAPLTGANVSTGCRSGETLIRTSSGATSCTRTNATNIIVGDTPALDPALFETLQAQAAQTGQPVAYTDGDLTITVSPAPSSGQ
ncbi:hypothetical protein [Shimia sp. MMG029]|uniref:hypothetical protein n=1 Tax=Shimia sp. MMG029 TaxID=3021978 RepID=UPI0022FF0BB8|nr:hypothetical protein [Shimia sp. MMG029]MDA5558352.1 hypothetical protein [Shimia sp. MMG029]